MTDDLEPIQDPTTAAPTDPTTRIETPTTPTAPATPTAPLTRAGRESLTASTDEHEVAWATVAPATPVVATRSPRPPRSRLRWAISLAVVALIIATTAAVAAVITGRSTDATVLGYVPDQTVSYTELRLDLPGDQRRAVGEFLSKFPGFADQAALESKLDQVLDDLVKNATDGSQTYTTDIKPWFGGEFALALGPLPPASSLKGDDAAAMGSFRGLTLLSLTDPVAAQAWFDAAIAKNGATTTKQSYGGAIVTLFDKTGGLQPAFAIVDGKVAVAGDLVSVKAAVDTQGSGGFAKEPGPKAALDSMSDDHVGFAYLALHPLLDWSNDLATSLGTAGGVTSTSLYGTLEKALPDWAAYSLRFQSDAIVMEATSPPPETRFGPSENRRSTIAEHIPGTALVAAMSNDLGTTIKQTLDLYRGDASFKPVMDQIDQALGLIGGADAAFGWAGDSAVVVSAPDGTPEGGAIIAPNDKAAADHLLTALRAFIAIGGAQQGITVTDEAYDGTTITVIDLGDLSKLAGMAGAAGATGAAGLPALPTGHIKIAYAVTDDVVVIGSGSSFVKDVIDTTKDTSLASNGRYTSLADRAGSGTGATWVDITAIRGLVEKAASGSGADSAALARYQTDIKPFLAPFDALYASSSTGNDLDRSVIYVTVK
jgi:hypothetical protein